MNKPHSAFKAASLALEFESKLSSFKSQKPTLFSRPNNLSNTQNIHNQPNATPSYRVPPSILPNPIEHQQRRDKGLCFQCGDKFSPDHKSCNNFSQLEIT